jgi:ribonuclease HIII
VNSTAKYGIPQDLRLLLDEWGVRVADHREINHATQYRLERGSVSVLLNVFSTGKVAIQGKSSELKGLLEGWKDARDGRRRSAAGGSLRSVEAVPQLGIDEAGKGDYFGPLVVAGVRIPDREAVKKLISIGVRDSKLLKSDERVRLVSSRLLGLLAPENVCVVVISPPQYEARRKEAGDVNRLLAEIDAEIIEKLMDEVRVIVVDEFARDTRARLEPVIPERVRLEVRPRAEDDAAVAAASVVARARFLEELRQLSKWAAGWVWTGWPRRAFGPRSR